MPTRGQPVPGGQQREPVIQAIQQLGHTQRLHPRRRQLDRQRHPVQPRHHQRHHRPGLRVQGEMRVSAAGPVHKQRHRLSLGRISRLIRARQGKRSQPVPGLPGHRQRLPAGRQDLHVIAGQQQPRAQTSGRADHMLAVIQHQQQLLPGQHPRHRISGRLPRLLRYPQRRRHHRGHQGRVPHRRQLCQPHPVREPARHLPGHLPGQPGLPRPARPGHRHQPMLLQQGRDLAHRTGPADEAGQRDREAMHATARSERRRLPHSRHHNRSQPPPYSPAAPGNPASAD